MDPHKGFVQALVLQSVVPGLGSYYVDGNWRKPVIYTSISLLSGISAAAISGTDWEYKDPFVFAGFALLTGTMAVNYFDLIRTCVRNDVRFVHFKVNHNSIVVSIDF